MQSGKRCGIILPLFLTNMTSRFADRLAGGDSTIKMAEVSDCVDVILRMSADEGVRGRAAAIAAEKKSFDLCDNSEGLGVGQILSDPEFLKFFGYGPAVQKKQDKAVEKDEISEKVPENVSTTNGNSSDAPSADPALGEAIKPLELTPEKVNVIVPVTEVQAV